MTPIPTGLLGGTGRMGMRVARLIEAHYADRLAVVASPTGQSPDLDAFATCDIVIDFSLPEGTARLTDWLDADKKRPATVVSGTTGCGLPITLFDGLDAIATDRTARPPVVGTPRV